MKATAKAVKFLIAIKMLAPPKRVTKIATPKAEISMVKLSVV